MAPDLKDLLSAVGAAAGGLLFADYTRLRWKEYVDARAAKAQAALGATPDKPTTKCCDPFCNQ